MSASWPNDGVSTPDGCLVLPSRQGILGYAVSHPWLSGQPPQLNTRLVQLPVPADTFYIHDVALLPEARGTGAGGAVVRLLACQARSSGLASLSLVAVSGSVGFWAETWIRNGRECRDQVEIAELRDVDPLHGAASAGLNIEDIAFCNERLPKGPGLWRSPWSCFEASLGRRTSSTPGARRRRICAHGAFMPAERGVAMRRVRRVAWAPIAQIQACLRSAPGADMNTQTFACSRLLPGTAA